MNRDRETGINEFYHRNHMGMESAPHSLKVNFVSSPDYRKLLEREQLGRHPLFRALISHFLSIANLEGWVAGGELLGLPNDPALVNDVVRRTQNEVAVKDFFKIQKNYLDWNGIPQKPIPMLFFVPTLRRSRETADIILKNKPQDVEIIDIIYDDIFNERYNSLELSGKPYTALPGVTEYISEEGKLYFPTEGESPEQMMVRALNAWKLIRKVESSISFDKYPVFSTQLVGLSRWFWSIAFSMMSPYPLGWKRATNVPPFWQVGESILIDNLFPDFKLTSSAELKEYSSLFENRVEPLRLIVLTQGSKPFIRNPDITSWYLGPSFEPYTLRVTHPENSVVYSLSAFKSLPNVLAYDSAGFDYDCFLGEDIVTEHPDHLLTRMQSTAHGFNVCFEINERQFPQIRDIVDINRPADQAPYKRTKWVSHTEIIEYAKADQYQVKTIIERHKRHDYQHVLFIGNPVTFPEEVKRMIEADLQLMEQQLNIPQQQPLI